MAQLSNDPKRAKRAAARSCGSCSLCCSVLRVDELKKPAGFDCPQQQGEAGCAIHETRPNVCRSYHCLWLQGGLEDDERPDQTGGIIDLESTGFGVQLSIREAHLNAFDESPGLQAIAARYREEMRVRIVAAHEPGEQDRPFRVFEADGLEHRVQGDRVETYRDDALVEERKLPWAERLGTQISRWWRGRKAARFEGRRRQSEFGVSGSVFQVESAYREETRLSHDRGTREGLPGDDK